jgi:predicted dithiol-disulfide oxidoreductase (DUF899 family)
MSQDAEIATLEAQIFEQNNRLQSLYKDRAGEQVANYRFTTLNGETSMLDLFGDQECLLMIHNMGQGCRYCTLWADGFNGLLPHLESAMAVALVSKDAPDVQRRFANSRGWRFHLASHGGGDYMTEQCASEDYGNMPGVAVFERRGEVISRKNGTNFGPGDQFCSMWNLLGLAGLGESDWTPQFNYWKRPAKLDDGGANLLE